MMSRNLEIIINKTILDINKRSHEYLSIESILIHLLDDEVINDILVDVDCDIDSIKNDLSIFLDDSSNFSILSSEDISELNKIQFLDDNIRSIAGAQGIKYQPEMSIAMQRCLQRSALHIQSSEKDKMEAIHLLISMMEEDNSYGIFLLKSIGIDRFLLVDNISSTDEELDENIEVFTDEDNKLIPGKKLKFLQKYTISLTNLAKKNKIDKIIGRKFEIQRVIEVLGKKRKNNPILVGDAGVGKTAIGEGLALKIINKEVPFFLEDVEVYSLDLGSLLAGAKFRGDFEERLKGVLKDLKTLSDINRPPILFIDEIHSLMGAGSTGSGSMDASNLLRPYLSLGNFRVLGCTTYDEYRKFIEKDSAFERRFQKIDVGEPTNEDTLRILKGLRPSFEKFHNLKFNDESLKISIELSNRYITDRKNPDKSLDVIDEAAAKMNTLDNVNERIITKELIEEVIAKMANIPKLTIADNEVDKLSMLEENLKKTIFGQDEAITKVCDAFFLSRSGLRESGRPIASFLFTGPSGVGKTELAKQLAVHLGSKMKRIDMSEYMEKHSVSKLVGAPPGYIGHESGGILTDFVKNNPHSVLLLDEIEKAHIDVYNILLQVMDNGQLTDSHGRTSDFSNCLIILTSNLGAKEAESGNIGLGSKKDSRKNSLSKQEKAIKSYFSPEFRNRLDAIIYFNGLFDENILMIVEKNIILLSLQLKNKNIYLEVSKSAKTWLAKRGFSPSLGARPIARTIDEYLRKVLSREILFGNLINGGKCIVTLSKDNKVNNKLKFSYKK